jgi:hypothetical protein
MAAIAIANGVLREYTYGTVIPELAAHQVSTLTGILFTGAFVGYLHRRWPLESIAQAWLIGVAWLLLTVLFEFGFGRYVAGHPWGHLLADYDLRQGRVWSLFLLWLLVMPALIHHFASARARRS